MSYWIRVDPNPMTNLIRGGKFGYRDIEDTETGEEGCVTTEAKTEVVHLRAKDC